MTFVQLPAGHDSRAVLLRTHVLRSRDHTDVRSGYTTIKRTLPVTSPAETNAVIMWQQKDNSLAARRLATWNQVKEKSTNIYISYILLARWKVYDWNRGHNVIEITYSHKDLYRLGGGGVTTYIAWSDRYVPPECLVFGLFFLSLAIKNLPVHLKMPDKILHILSLKFSYDPSRWLYTVSLSVKHILIPGPLYVSVHI